MMSYFTAHLSFNQLVKDFFLIGEHLAKLQAKWLIVSCAPIRLALLSSKCWSHQINWITCVLRTETVTNLCYVNRQINVSLLSTVLTYRPIDWRHQWLTDCWSCTAFCCDSFSLLWQLCTVSHGIFYMADVNAFLLVKLIMQTFILKVFQWLSLPYQFASLTP